MSRVVTLSITCSPFPACTDNKRGRRSVGRAGNVSVPWPDDDAVTDGGAGGKTISGTIFVVIRGAERGWRSVLPRKPQRKQGETASIVNNDA